MEGGEGGGGWRARGELSGRRREAPRSLGGQVVADKKLIRR